QAKVAVLSAEPLFSDVLTGVGRRNSLSRFEGLPASELDAPQKRLLFALVEEYVRNADVDAAERHLDAIQRAGLDQLHFSWRSDQRFSQPLLLSDSWTTLDHRIRRAGAQSYPHHHAGPAKRLRNGLARPAL